MYLSFFLLTAICNFHSRWFCVTSVNRGRKLLRIIEVFISHICVKPASATRESRNLLFHFVNESDIFGMRCKWLRDVVKVQIPGRRVFIYTPANIMHTFYFLQSDLFLSYILTRIIFKRYQKVIEFWVEYNEMLSWTE